MDFIQYSQSNCLEGRETVSKLIILFQQLEQLEYLIKPFIKQLFNKELPLEHVLLTAYLHKSQYVTVICSPDHNCYMTAGATSHCMYKANSACLHVLVNSCRNVTASF